MKNLRVSFLLMVFVFFYSCNKTAKDTFIEGAITVLVDESVLPLVEDQAAVFENTYRAKINLQAGSEVEMLNELLQNDTVNVAIFTRMLTTEEETPFLNKKINPRITRFAIDAVALIVNQNMADTLVDLQKVIDYIQGDTTALAYDLVFDNPNSSSLMFLYELAGVERSADKKVYAKKNSEELISYIAENAGYIGVVGINWLSQAPESVKESMGKVKVLSVKNVPNRENDTLYYQPTQANIAKRIYPLTRSVYLLNYQGTTGLGMGFASFVAGEVGQKVVLTSGLAPVRVAPLKIEVKKEIDNKNE